MTRSWWQRPRWCLAAGTSAAGVAAVVGYVEGRRWIEDEHPAFDPYVRWIVLGLVALVGWLLPTPEALRFEGGRGQVKAHRRALKQGYIPIGTDLEVLRSDLARRVERQDGGYVAGAMVAVPAVILFYAWPDDPSSGNLLLVVGSAVGAALLIALLLVPLARGRRHAAQLLEAVAEREAEDGDPDETP